MRWLNEYPALVEWWQGKTEVLRQKPIPGPLCPQIPHGLVLDWFQASAGGPVTVQAMAQPEQEGPKNVWQSLYREFHISQIIKYYKSRILFTGE
jgi:hypothetical protein